MPPGERELAPGADLSFVELAASLAPQRLILLAVEIAGPDGAQICVNPAPEERGAFIRSAQLTGLFCVGEVDRRTR